MTNQFEHVDECSTEQDKRIKQQAEVQGRSQKRAVSANQGTVPTVEQMSEKPTDGENGSMLTTSEIIDFAEGTDTYL